MCPPWLLSDVRCSGDHHPQRYRASRLVALLRTPHESVVTPEDNAVEADEVIDMVMVQEDGFKVREPIVAHYRVVASRQSTARCLGPDRRRTDTGRRSSRCAVAVPGTPSDGA